MRKPTLRIPGALLLATLAPMASAVQLAPVIPDPVILSGVVHSSQHLIIISGWNFGSTRPTVKLGGQSLTLKSFSPGQIVADLPADIYPATYLLTIGDERDPGKSDSFALHMPDIHAKTCQGDGKPPSP